MGAGKFFSAHKMMFRKILIGMSPRGYRQVGSRQQQQILQGSLEGCAVRRHCAVQIAESSATNLISTTLVQV